jgi:hypothetical protein
MIDEALKEYLEKTIRSIIKEEIEPLIIGPRWRTEYLKKLMKEHGFITWSNFSDDPEFLRYFNSSSSLRDHANKFVTSGEWQTGKVDTHRYYFIPPHTIEELRATASWMDANPKDSRFLKHLIEDYIIQLENVNILVVLKNRFPHWSDSKRELAIQSLSKYIKKHGYKIEYQGSNFRYIK